MKPFLTYDDANMWSARVGSAGASVSELHAIEKDLKRSQQSIEKSRKSKSQGFFDVPFDNKIVSLITKQVARLKKQGVQHLVVIGIGGSDLGARTIWQALGDPKKGMWVTFVSNPDPEAVHGYTGAGTWWNHTALCVISKSGTTLETLSIFLTLRKGLIETVGEKKHKERVVVITEVGENPLHQMALENSYAILPHPENIGGRFSVLSVVGLFPAACGGVDIKKLLAGAKWVEQSRRTQGTKHAAIKFAALHYLALTQHNQPNHVLMPYAEWLGAFGMWFRQLWAESLGKDRQGPTPIAGLGPTDQHSQLQLYVDGPKDKVVTFLSVDTFRRHVNVPKFSDLPKSLSYLSGLDMESIMQAEKQGTEHALTKAGRPNGTLRMPSLTPEALGALFQFFMIATATLGELLGVDPYNQPGVEEGKRETKRLLTTLLHP